MIPWIVPDFEVNIGNQEYLCYCVNFLL